MKSEKLSKHFEKFAHLILYSAFVLGAVAIFLARYDAYRQFIVIILMVAFYLTWGFIFHHLKGDAAKKLSLEYLVIGLLALCAALFVLVL